MDGPKDSPGLDFQPLASTGSAPLAGQQHQHPQAASASIPAAPHGHAPGDALALGVLRAVPALSPRPLGVRQGPPEELCVPCPVLQVTLEMRRLETINVLVG